MIVQGRVRRVSARRALRLTTSVLCAAGEEKSRLTIETGAGPKDKDPIYSLAVLSFPLHPLPTV